MSKFLSVTATLFFLFLLVIVPAASAQSELQFNRLTMEAVGKCPNGETVVAISNDNTIAMSFTLVSNTGTIKGVAPVGTSLAVAGIFPGNLVLYTDVRTTQNTWTVSSLGTALDDNGICPVAPVSSTPTEPAWQPHAAEVIRHNAVAFAGLPYRIGWVGGSFAGINHYFFVKEGEVPADGDLNWQIMPGALDPNPYLGQWDTNHPNITGPFTPHMKVVVQILLDGEWSNVATYLVAASDRCLNGTCEANVMVVGMGLHPALTPRPNAGTPALAWFH